MIKTRSLTSRTNYYLKILSLTFWSCQKNETWGNIYEHDNMQDTFNSFLNTLITFESCFPAQHINKK